MRRKHLSGRRGKVALLTVGILLVLSACGIQPASIEPPPENDPLDIEMPPREKPVPETAAGEEEDLILSSVNASVSGNQTLRLDAIGKMEPDTESRCGIREVRVYENGKLRQTVSVSESGTIPGPVAPLGSGYTESPSVEAAMTVHDMNFDGWDDLDLYARITTNSVPHHYWLWNSATNRYVYAYTLPGASAHPESGEVVSEYRYDDITDYIDHYRYGGSFGSLVLVSRYVQDWKRGTEDFPLVEYYEFPDGQETLIRQEFTDYDDAGLTIREIREVINGELWPVRLEQLEMIDGELQVVRTAQLQLPEPEPEEEIPEEGVEGAEGLPDTEGGAGPDAGTVGEGTEPAAP